jgi:predicted O-linked N-acetylglucosamine transferase (SPINDLY family)
VAGAEIQQATQMLRQGRLREAETACRRVLQQQPQDPDALHCLGLIAMQAGQPEPAMALIRQAIAAAPGRSDYWYNLGETLRRLRRLPEAETALREALRLRSDFPQAVGNLGAILAQQGRFEEAMPVLREAIRLRPNDHFGYLNFGKVARQHGDVREAEAAFRRAIALAPNFAPAYNMLGGLLRESGDTARAVETYRKAIELDPDLREAYDNLCYTLQFDPDSTPAQVLEEHRKWSNRFAEPLAKEIKPHPNDRSPDRRLRVGYVSPNLRRHVIGLFMEPILERHDRERFEIYCYADIAQPDDVAKRLQSHVSVWRPTWMMNDEQLAQTIRDDRIDVLVDLNLHMRGSRLLAFARKPAPVQITHLAYCGTSGLSVMDWCVTDTRMSPPGEGDDFFSERLLRLPETYWCYRPWPGSPDVSPLPARTNGFVTFGSLNSLAKVNDRVLALWRQVLDAVPKSRLLIHAHGGTHNEIATTRFRAAGLPMERLTMVGMESVEQYMARYHSIDIALDPFPYGGGTTTLDALWMGVPVVTVAGATPLSRTGLTLLHAVGLDELVTTTPGQYVQTARGLANDLPRLERVRSSLRNRLRGSVLMDEPRYVRELESVYRYAWKTWCYPAG